MAYRRFFVEHPPGENLCIDGDLFHHIRDVCRFGEGDQFEVLPGNKQAVLMRITSVGKRELIAHHDERVF